MLGGRTTTATAPRCVVGTTEYAQYEDAPPPCDTPHLTPRAVPPGITGQPLVAALAHGIDAVLGQVAVDAKSNEIPAVRELLKAFTDLAGAVITVDALHTQSDTAQAITGRHADYVMTVKANMPTLYKQLKKLPWTAIPATSAVSTGHGRRARRTIKAVLAPAWIEFAGAAQVAQVRRTVTKKGKKTVEVVYLITSDRGADPATLAAWVRGHWEIENRLHWVRDVTYQEDKSLVRTGSAPRVMASLRSLAISLLRLDGQANIAAANRHHARDPQRTLKLLQTA
ncbi:ISAs1 family transposase [Streptomyces sp. NPDC057565]|uniref:ISAs1 family transposase n=1 Tax=Streptomyces sp. NPDC057565 TaxID=3346169 RepID=UPI0036B72A14